MTEPEELPTGFPSTGDSPTGEPPSVAPDIESLTVALAPFMRRAKWLRATMAANEAAKAEEIKAVVAEIEQRHAAVQQANQMKLDHLEREIEHLGRQRLAFEVDRKSVILLYGQIGVRRQPTKVEITDIAALDAACMELGLAVPLNPAKEPPPQTVDKRALLKLVEAAGTEFPGMRLVLGEERFFFDSDVTDNGGPNDADT